MANLADLAIGIGVKGMGSLKGDFDKVPRMAKDVTNDAESTFESMDARFPGVEDGAEEATGGAVSIFEGLGGPLGMAAGAAGAAAGALLVSEFFDAMDRDRLGDRLAAQLDLTGDDAAEAGRIAGDLYADAYGDSLDGVHDAVGQVASTLVDNFDGDEVEDLTAKALDLAATFDVDVGEAVNTVGVMMRTGLARDADHGFDLVVSAMQNVPAEMRGELLPILEEYSVNLAEMGFDGNEAFGLLVDAAGRGRFALDKTGDAIKEFGILATEETTPAVVEAFETIGLDAGKMADMILEGGDTAREGLDMTIDGLLGVEDKSARAELAVALFGAPVEDLTKSQIPDFLRGLQGMDGGFGDVEGAATRMGDTLNENVATDFESFKRTAGAAIDTWIAENVLPGAEKVLDAFNEDGIGGAVDKAVELWEQAQPKVQAWFDGTFVPWFEGTAVPWMAYIGGELGAALMNALMEVVVDLAPTWGNTLVDALAVGPLNEWARDQFGEFDWDVDVPDVSNPVSRPQRPTSGGFSGSLSSLTAFHSGGVSPFGGMANLSAKERVLTDRQTAAFDRLVDHLTGPQVPRVGAIDPTGIGGGTSGVESPHVTIQAQTNASPQDISRDLLWTLRTA